MLNKLGIVSAVIFLLTGAVLLYGSVSGPDTSQTARLLGGATSVSLGLLAILLVVKDWLEWRRQYKIAGRRGHQ